MSKYGWERGEIKLSVKEFGSVRRDMIAFHNQRQARLFERAKVMYQTVKESGKGQRNFDFPACFENLMRGSNRSSFYDSYDTDGYDEICGSIFPSVLVEGKGWQRSKRPKAPKKAQFAPLKQSAERVPVGDEAGIGFDKKRRVVIWSVCENNHSVERAHENAMGKEFFKRLSRVNWTRGTGGEIVGNDEYNQEANYAGGGGNYVTARYGSAEKQYRQSFR